MAYVVTQVGVYYDNERAKWIEKFMTKMIPAKLCDMGREE